MRIRRAKRVDVYLEVVADVNRRLAFQQSGGYRTLSVPCECGCKYTINVPVPPWDLNPERVEAVVGQTIGHLNKAGLLKKRGMKA